MGNIYGRQVVVPLTNKSGGSVIAGDVVVVDTSNNDAFTTSTAGAVTGTVGVAQETIASNAVGRILTGGYAALINTSASVTRGNYGKTHTVVKQAVDAGSSRVAGTFVQFLTGGTTPDGMVFNADLGAGSGALTSEPYLTSAATAGLSADTVKPELADFNLSGATPISMSGASTGTGVTVNASADMEGIVDFTNASYQQWDVASSIGTGDFDVRCRITLLGALAGVASIPLFQFYVADSSRTTSTALAVGMTGMGIYNSPPYIEGRTGVAGSGSGGSAWAWRLPFVGRIRRVGTAITVFVSFDEGRSWSTLYTTTSSLNIAKIGIYGNPNTSTSSHIGVHWIRSF